MNVRHEYTETRHSFAVEGEPAVRAKYTRQGLRRALQRVDLRVWDDDQLDWRFYGWTLRKDGQRAANGSFSSFIPEEADVADVKVTILRMLGLGAQTAITEE